MSIYFSKSLRPAKELFHIFLLSFLLFSYFPKTNVNFSYWVSQHTNNINTLSASLLSHQNNNAYAHGRLVWATTNDEHSYIFLSVLSSTEKNFSGGKFLCFKTSN